MAATESSEMNRRQLLTLAAVTAAAATVCACSCESVLAAEEGGSGAPSRGPTPKTAMEKTPVDVGPKADYAKEGIYDKFTKSHRVIMVNHEAKIWATCSTCTHKNCATKAKDTEIVCGCHGSKFSVQGTSTKGPAKGSLLRYALKVDDKGNIIVDRAKTYSEKEWESEGASIPAA